jgi:DNA-binding transcriptional MerR regulator
MIKDVARLSGYSIYTLKFYLKLGLMQEIGRSPETRFRYFDDSTLNRLAQIRTLRKQGKSLAQIKQVVGSPDV